VFQRDVITFVSRLEVSLSGVKPARPNSFRATSQSISKFGA